MSESPISEPQDWRILNFFFKDKLNFLYETGSFADLEIQVKSGEEKKTIKCHSLILKMVSPVFEKMLSGYFREKETIQIDDADANIFNLFMKHIYVETTEFDSVEEAWGVYEFATKYLIAPIQKRCLDYILIKSSDYSCACFNYNFADFYDLRDIREKNYKTILQNLKKVFQGDVFYTLSEKGVSRILDESILSVSEGLLFENVAEWIQQNIAGSTGDEVNLRKNHLFNSLIPKIRFSEMTVKEFATHVGTCGLIPKDMRFEIMMSLTLGIPFQSVAQYTQKYPHRRYLYIQNCACESTGLCGISREMAITHVDFTQSGAMVKLNKSLNPGETLSFGFKMNSDKPHKSSIRLLYLKCNEGYYITVSVNSKGLTVYSNYCGNNNVFSKCLYDRGTHFLKLHYMSNCFSCYLDSDLKNLGGYYYTAFTDIVFGDVNNPGTTGFCIQQVVVGSLAVQFERDHKVISQLSQCSC